MLQPTPGPLIEVWAHQRQSITIPRSTSQLSTYQPLTGTKCTLSLGQETVSNELMSSGIILRAKFSMMLVTVTNWICKISSGILQECRWKLKKGLTAIENLSGTQMHPGNQWQDLRWTKTLSSQQPRSTFTQMICQLMNLLGWLRLNGSSLNLIEQDSASNLWGLGNHRHLQ